MSGWKTWAAAIILGGSAAAKALGHEAVSEVLLMIGAALGLVGIGHKVEKSAQ